MFAYDKIRINCLLIVVLVISYGMAYHLIIRGKFPRFPTRHLSFQLDFGDEAWTNAVGTFQRNVDETGITVTYLWLDYNRKSKQISFQIQADTLYSSSIRLGIHSESRSDFYKQHWPEMLKQQPEWRNIVDHIIQKKGPIHLSKQDDIDDAIRLKFLEGCRQLEKEFYISRGFYVRKGKRVEIDYTGFVAIHSIFLKDCMRQWIDQVSTETMKTSECIQTLMSFVQQMEYEIPPMYDGQRWIHGLWPPLETLVRGKGDCDTKAVLFSTMLSRIEGIESMILIIPGHAFNGLVGWHKRMPRDTILHHRGQDVLLLDLTSTPNYAEQGAIHELDKQNIRNQIPMIYQIKQ